MRLILKRSIVSLTAMGAFCVATGWSADNRVVIRPEDFAWIELKGPTVQVLIKAPKAKQLADNTRHTAIEFSVPFAHAKEVFIGETRFAAGSATISFNFPTEASAADFAELLKAAKVKILSQCDCH